MFCPKKILNLLDNKAPTCASQGFIVTSNLPIDNLVGQCNFEHRVVSMLLLYYVDELLDDFGMLV